MPAGDMATEIVSRPITRAHNGLLTTADGRPPEQAAGGTIHISKEKKYDNINGSEVR
jgi:hypothetical protein